MSPRRKYQIISKRQKPTEHELRTFENQFENVNQVEERMNSYLDNFRLNINNARKMAKDLQRLLLLGDSKISNNINRVSEEDLMFTFSAVAELGLSRWRPNILGNADSLYNVAHERIALVTFRQMASQHRYAFMSVNLSTIDDLALLKKCYRSFVFSYLQTQLRKETKQPGRVMQDAKLKAVYSRRLDVSVIPLLISDYSNGHIAWESPRALLEDQRSPP